MCFASQGPNHHVGLGSTRADDSEALGAELLDADDWDFVDTIVIILEVSFPLTLLI